MLIFRSAVCVFVSACSTAAIARPDLNAFLNHRAMSVNQLVRQVKTDPEVMDRYRRHYAMNEQELLAFLGSLQLAKLSDEGVYKVFSVPPGGWIKMRHDRLRRGTPVFATMTGEPLLLVKCGNPLTQGPKNPVAVNESTTEVTGGTEVLKELTVAADSPLSEDLIALAPGTPQMPPEQIVTINQSPVVILPGAFGLSPWLLGALGVFFIDDEDDTPNVVVPEPATMAFMAFGLTALITRRASKKPRR